MDSRQVLQHCQLDSESNGYLEHAMEEMNFSARTHDRIQKVDRTLVDLAGPWISELTIFSKPSNIVRWIANSFCEPFAFLTACDVEYHFLIGKSTIFLFPTNGVRVVLLLDIHRAPASCNYFDCVAVNDQPWLSLVRTPPSRCRLTPLVGAKIYEIMPGELSLMAGDSSQRTSIES